MDEINKYVATAAAGDFFPTTRRTVRDRLTDPRHTTPAVKAHMEACIAKGQGPWGILMDNGYLEE